jgi:hypothetical protein
MDAMGIVLFVLFFGALAWWLLRPRPGKPQVCAACEHVGPTRGHTRGSTVLELVLWLCFVLPGLVYSLWRLSTRRQVCAQCGSEQLVPLDSPAGRRIAAAQAAR